MNGLISEDYLMHHGVKGMKWGVRHNPISVGRIRKSSSHSRQQSKKIDSKKWLKRGAIAAGVILGASAGIYLAKSGKGKQLINIGKNFVQSKTGSKAFTPEQLRSMGISTIEPKTFKVNTVEIPKTKINTTDVFKSVEKPNVTRGPQISKPVTDRVLQSRSADYKRAVERHGNLVNKYMETHTGKAFENRNSDPTIANAIKQRDKAKRALDNVMYPNKTYNPSFPKKSTKRLGQNTVTKIIDDTKEMNARFGDNSVKSSKKTVTIKSNNWRELATMKKSKTWNTSLDDLRRAGLL